MSVPLPVLMMEKVTLPGSVTLPSLSPALATILTTPYGSLFLVMVTLADECSELRRGEIPKINRFNISLICYRVWCNAYMRRRTIVMYAFCICS